MSGKIIKTNRYYACSRRLVKFDCDARHVPAEITEREIEQALLKQILSLENLAQIQARLQSEYNALAQTATQDEKKLTQRLATVTRSASNLIADIAAHGPSDTISKTLRNLEEERRQITARLGEIEKQRTAPRTLSQLPIEEIAAHLAELITNSDTAQKRNYLAAFIQSITLTREPETIRVTIIYHPPFF